MSFVDRLQRRFGRYAIPNLTAFLIAAQVALYVLQLMPEGIALDRLVLNPERVVHGEWWRLITFPFQPPILTPMGPLFALFYFSLFHLFGTTLQRHLGAFRYNLFLFTGYLASIAAAFAASAIEAQTLRMAGAAGVPTFAPIMATNEFLYSSLFLAFARLYPNFTLNLLIFFLPVRIKWFALLQWVTFAYLAASGTWPTRLLILATVLNYALFFGPEHVRELKYGHRRRAFQSKTKKALLAPTHVCRTCGKSSADSPRTLFRYCSKCAEQVCYCPEHIRDHEHVVAAGAPAVGEER